MKGYKKTREVERREKERRKILTLKKKPYLKDVLELKKIKMASKDYFITNSKIIAIRKLKELFSKVIISNVYKDGKGYRIEWVNQKDFYKNSVESQKDMDKYLDFMLNKFESEDNQKEIKTDKQIEDEQKAKIYDDLSNKIKK